MKLTYLLIHKLPAMLKMISMLVTKVTIKMTTKRTYQTSTQDYSSKYLMHLLMAVCRAGLGISSTALSLKIFPATTLTHTPSLWRELRGAATHMASLIMKVVIWPRKRYGLKKQWCWCEARTSSISFHTTPKSPSKSRSKRISTCRKTRLSWK